MLRFNRQLCSALLIVVLLCSTTICYASNDVNLDAEFQTLEDIRLANPKRFIEGIQALEKLRQRFSPEQSKYYMLLKGYEQALLGNYSEALLEMEVLLTASQDDIYTFRAHNLALNIHVLSKQYLKAFIELDFVNKQLEFIDSATAKAQAIGNIAMLYNEIERYDIALQYSEYFLQKVNLDAKLTCRIETHRITSLFYLNKSEDFLEQTDQAIQVCRKAQELIPKLIIEQVKLRALQKMQNDVAAIELYQTLERDIQAAGYPLLSAGFNTYIAKSYLNENNLTSAEQHASRALTDIASMDVSLVHVELYSVLAELSKRQGHFQQSVGYFQQLLTLQQQYSNVKMRQQLAYHQAQGELEIKNQRIALLNKDNALLNLQKDVYEQEVKQTRILIAGLVLVLGTSLVMAYKGLTGQHRFKKIAEFDQLTGISNRYHFNNQAELALEFCQKNKQPVALILFDLDHFKQINDNYGHAAGDWALQVVVDTCRNFMRNNDVFGRIGGEEFAIVLPGCQTDKAMLIAEICRDAIAAIETEQSGTAFPLTASFGVSGSETSGYQLKQLLSDADKALYLAKDGGRDQVMSFTDATI